jgi:hypothetical protein
MYETIVSSTPLSSLVSLVTSCPKGVSLGWVHQVLLGVAMVRTIQRLDARDVDHVCIYIEYLHGLLLSSIADCYKVGDFPLPTTKSL